MNLLLEGVHKSIKDRAKQYQAKIEENNPSAEAYDFESAYIRGAEDQMAICFGVLDAMGYGYLMGEIHKRIEKY